MLDLLFRVRSIRRYHGGAEFQEHCFLAFYILDMVSAQRYG